MPEGRVTQTYATTLITVTTTMARVTQTCSLALTTGSGKARVSQTLLQVLTVVARLGSLRSKAYTIE